MYKIIERKILNIIGLIVLFSICVNYLLKMFRKLKLILYYFLDFMNNVVLGMFGIIIFKNVKVGIVLGILEFSFKK